MPIRGVPMKVKSACGKERSSMQYKNERNNSIYIIDNGYRLVYMNSDIRRIFPQAKIGDICYQQYRGEPAPCNDCPIGRGRNGVGGTQIIYNKMVDQWVEASYAEIEWPSVGECVLIIANEIRENNKNVLFTLAEEAAYDELFELNLTQNSYRVLFHTPNKYVMPAKNGILDEMCQEVAERMIHPEDREAFLRFWDFNKIVGLLKQAKSLKAEFRKRCLSGGYRWAEQVVVPVSHCGEEDEVLMCFILDIHEKKTQEDDLVRQLTEVNALTGLYNGIHFFQKTAAVLQLRPEQRFCMMVVDIEHFKIFNEWYGREAGDELLRSVGHILAEWADALDTAAGYFGGDDFAILLLDHPTVLNDFEQQIKAGVQRYENTAGFLPALGLYAIDHQEMAVSKMYDRAWLAMDSVKGNYAKRIAWYDVSMKQRLEQDQELLGEMQRALHEREFVVYAQPKCNIRTGKIVGLESLVRWQHPEKGIIMPGEFIPLLERNGFITNLDVYMWEEVCKLLSKWIAEGSQVVPISVNVSRVDIYAIDVVQTLTEMVTRYELPLALLEIEITESAYAKEYFLMNRVIGELREKGFRVLIDDFGSAYSSLNMLKDINVDILKLDMQFLAMTPESLQRGVGILDAIIRMAKWLGLQMIAEGVETSEQVEFLLELGCEYAQGYYFYKPEPIAVIEAKLREEGCLDQKGIMPRPIRDTELDELFRSDVMGEMMLHNLAGGVAFYELEQKQLTILRANEQYYRIIGYNAVDDSRGELQMLSGIVKEDQAMVQRIFSKAAAIPAYGAEGVFGYCHPNGSRRWLKLRIFFFRQQEARKYFYGILEDVTIEKNESILLAQAREALYRADSQVASEIFGEKR